MFIIYAFYSNFCMGVHFCIEPPRAFAWSPTKGNTYIFPKFNGEGNASTNEHIIKYESIICLLNVVYEYVVCMLFPLSFKGKALYLFNVLPIHSVHSWSQFKRLFENAFDDYDPIKTYRDLGEL